MNACYICTLAFACGCRVSGGLAVHHRNVSLVLPVHHCCIVVTASFVRSVHQVLRGKSQPRDGVKFTWLVSMLFFCICHGCNLLLEISFPCRFRLWTSSTSLSFQFYIFYQPYQVTYEASMPHRAGCVKCWQKKRTELPMFPQYNGRQDTKDCLQIFVQNITSPVRVPPNSMVIIVSPCESN